MNASKIKLLRWVGLASLGGVGILVVAVLWHGLSKPQPPGPASSEAAAGQLVAPVPAGEAPLTQPPLVAAPSAPELVTLRPDTGGPAIPMVRIKPEQTLATVNGAAITLKDLLPLPKEKARATQVLSTERYGFLLYRAIEREVTYQAAQARGVTLTEAQRQRLEAARARSEEHEPGVFDTVQQNPANVEFEQRDAAAFLLEATLAERAGVPSPHVTSEQVQRYYQEHQAEYGLLPEEAAARAAAWENIDQEIRLKLAPQVQAEQQEKLQQYREQLKSSTQIAKAAS